jgi:hypothetical protein
VHGTDQTTTGRIGNTDEECRPDRRTIRAAFSYFPLVQALRAFARSGNTQFGRMKWQV